MSSRPWPGSALPFTSFTSISASRKGTACRRASAARPGRCMAAASTTCANTLSPRPNLPKELTWFKWESYSTWITGFFLLVLGLLSTRQTSTRSTRPSWRSRPGRRRRSGSAPSGSAGSSMTGSAGRRSERTMRSLVAVLFLYMLAAAWGFMHLFSGRAAFLHTGAMIATWMTGSVFLVIIPNQKKVVAALLAGADSRPEARSGRPSSARRTTTTSLCRSCS